MRIRPVIKTLCVLAALAVTACFIAPAALAADAGQEARELFLNPISRLMCAARAGDTLQYPPNSWQAFQSASGMGVDIITTTAQLTKDGQFVLLDSANTLGICVDAKGKDVDKNIPELTMTQLKDLMLKPTGSRAMAGCAVLTLKQALDICKGNCLLMVSAAEELREDLVKFIAENKAEDFVILRGRGSGEDFAAWAPETNMAVGYYSGNIVFMATKEIANCLENKTAAVELASGNPYSVIFSRTVMKRFKGRCRAMVSTADPASCGKREDNAQGWDNLASKGYNIIETDYPGELLEYIRDIEAARGELERRIEDADALCASGDYPAEYTGELLAAVAQGRVFFGSTALSIVREASYQVSEAAARLQNGRQADERGTFSVTPGKIAAALLCTAAILAAQVYTYKKSRRQS